MMRMTNWSVIPSAEVNKPSTAMVGGVSFEVTAAYFDVPSAARFIVDEESQDFIIDFKYLTESESTKTEIQGDVSLLVGKETKRIYQIRIKSSALSVDVKSGITFKIIVSADSLFKQRMRDFKNIGNSNLELVEKCLNWGIESKQLNLASAY
jgi:hypothetical protein